MKRDTKLIPKALLDKAAAAQAKLETLKTAAQRKAYIDDNADLWKEFRQYLVKFSYGKCWYSESDEPLALFDIDHFRPKGRAKRGPSKFDDGYQWLAFSFENFRLAAQRSNRRSTDEVTGGVVGKADWFPLLDGSPTAAWDDRCTSQEKPLLLDPTVSRDTQLIDVGGDGLMGPSEVCLGAAKKRVEASIEYYGLNLPAATSSRKRLMRAIVHTVETLEKILEESKTDEALAERMDVIAQVERLIELTNVDQPFSRAAKAELVRRGRAAFCAGPEHAPPMH